MADSSGNLPSSVEYQYLEQTYDLSSMDGVKFLPHGSSITSPRPGKMGVYLKSFDARLHLPLTDFQEEVVAFEMICSANGVLPDYFVFKYFFSFCCTRDKCTSSVRRGGHTLVPDGKIPKNRQGKWLWVNHGLAGSGRYRAKSFSDLTPKLFPHNQSFVYLLKNIQVTPEDYSEVMLSGVESTLSMAEVLRKCYRGKLEHQEVDLVDILPPPRRVDQISLATSASTPSVATGTPTPIVVVACPITTVAPLTGTCSSLVGVNEDSKDGIISDVCRV
ncbi:unnamed protein product [Lactuca saligna]|uniref:Uncharacterized protein n=1 Tax=Lactuca saligna TaxID=75948 RepID=A0AA35VLA6_LACSI|nr:unnamed protein product [Lactuca saligna]